MMDAVEAHYVDNKPRHISKPATSAFKIISGPEFDRLDDQTVQNILRQQHIVVFDHEKPQCKFDLEGLETLAPLNRKIIIHGKCCSRFFRGALIF